MTARKQQPRRTKHDGKAGRFTYASQRMCACGCVYGEHTHETHRCPNCGDDCGGFTPMDSL